MLKYIKYLIEKTKTKYFVIKGVQLFTIVFKKPKNCLIRPGNVEISRYTQKKPTVLQASGQLPLHSEKWRAAKAVIAEGVFAYMCQMSGLGNSDILNSLTDLRTGKIYEDFQITLNIPDNSKPKDKEILKYLKENKDEMQKMLYHLKKQEDLRREKAYSSSNKSVDGLKDSIQIKQNLQVEGSLTKMLKEMLRSGEQILKVAETNKEVAKEDKQGLIVIDDVLKCEESEAGTARHVIAKTASIVPSNSLSSGNYTSYYVTVQQTDYLHNLIELNRIIDRKMRNLRDPRKSNDTKKVRTNPSVPTKFLK